MLINANNFFQPIHIQSNRKLVWLISFYINQNIDSFLFTNIYISKRIIVDCILSIIFVAEHEPN